VCVCVCVCVLHHYTTLPSLEGFEQVLCDGQLARCELAEDQSVVVIHLEGLCECVCVFDKYIYDSAYTHPPTYIQSQTHTRTHYTHPAVHHVGGQEVAHK
jgi:hypothetical protein